MPPKLTYHYPLILTAQNTDTYALSKLANPLSKLANPIFVLLTLITIKLNRMDIDPVKNFLYKVTL